MTDPHTHTYTVVDVPGRYRYVIAGMALLIALGFGVVTWMILQRNAGLHERQQLACQVERLGGKPIGNVKCPPPKKKSAPTTSSLTPTPVLTTAPGKRTFVAVPSGPRNNPPATHRATSKPHASQTPSSHPTSPRPKPKPSECTTVTGVVSVCLTPPPLPFEPPMVWIW